MRSSGRSIRLTILHRIASSRHCTYHKPYGSVSVGGRAPCLAFRCGASMTRREAQGDPVLDRRLRLPCFSFVRCGIHLWLALLPVKDGDLLKYPGTDSRRERRGSGGQTQRGPDGLATGYYAGTQHQLRPGTWTAVPFMKHETKEQLQSSSTVQVSFATWCPSQNAGRKSMLNGMRLGHFAPIGFAQTLASKLLAQAARAFASCRHRHFFFLLCGRGSRRIAVFPQVSIVGGCGEGGTARCYCERPIWGHNSANRVSSSVPSEELSNRSAALCLLFCCCVIHMTPILTTITVWTWKT